MKQSPKSRNRPPGSSKKEYTLQKEKKMPDFKIMKFLLVVTVGLFALISNLYSAEKKEQVSTETAVIFNTRCAKCHEGECSGRLSFDTGSEAARSHIGRYAGENNISKSEIKAFFTLLNHMKKACTILMPGSQKAALKDLSRFATFSHTAYFIPLGRLKKGSYRLDIAAKEKAHYRLELLTDHFDPLAEVSVCPKKREDILFALDEPVTAFLRIRAKKPLHLISLKITDAAKQ